MTKYVMSVFVALFVPHVLCAEVVKNACLSVERKRADLDTCKCIQVAADATLTVSDQKLAASIILNPEKSQEIRSSSRRSMEQFWERYVNFGDLAEAYCPKS
ncbi:MAG: hypothetical protein EBT90_01915 [Rhodobacteraceae bacterium]|nr:hypothetical protein [Paracoccaceae bacterium]